jgi:alginate O-acetyltransferase complex protein AlgI
VFVAIGLWHGAGWNFVVYGLIHGSMVAWGHLAGELRARSGNSMPVYRGGLLALRIAAVFFTVVLTRILFRSNDLTAARDFVGALFRSLEGSFPVSAAGLAALAAAAALHFTPVQWRDRIMAYSATRPAWMLGIACVITLYMLMAMTRGSGGFIYFQF